jgi:hypothetical protein
MTFPIKVNKEEIFEAYLRYINPVFKLTGREELTDLEIKVLGKLMYLKDRYGNLEEGKLEKLLFHKETKKRIRASLSISEAVLNNTTKSLRDKNFIKYDKMIIPNPEIEDNKISINFILIENNEKI